MKISEIKAKSVITRSNLPDTDFVINPYIGCQHSCIYCYADFMKRFTHHEGDDWGSFVDVKINASDLITEKSKINIQNRTVLFGSVTDAYQPIEAKYKITRKILEKLTDVNAEFEILTKSSLVLRDIDLLKKFKNMTVGISLSNLDPDVQELIEPMAATPEKRIYVLQKLHESGIKNYLFISPMLPVITDVKELIRKTKSFVDIYLFENLNIRPNNWAKIKKFIIKHNKDLLSLCEQIRIDPGFWDTLEKEIMFFCEKEKVAYKIYFHHGGFSKKK